MRTIQEVGMEILQDHPSKLYIFGGCETGIKDKYISHLTQHYNGNIKTFDTVAEIIDLLSHKRMIPLPPTLYVVRYDDDFISALDDKLAKKLSNLNINGTVVCSYFNEKSMKKLEKYLSDYLVEINRVDAKFLFKYLQNDFPTVSTFSIENVIKLTDDYSKASNVCRSLSMLSETEQNNLTSTEIKQLFGLDFKYDETILKQGIASRNFAFVSDILDRLTDYNDFFYSVLSVCVELEKILSTKCNSYLKNYVGYWNIVDINNLFEITYEELCKLRSINADAKQSAYYILSLMQFSPIQKFV